VSTRTISRADRALIEKLARREVTVSATQIERWRQAGLMPTNERHGLGRGPGSRSTAPPWAVEQATELAQIVKRGQPLEEVALIMLARGRWVRDDAWRAGYRHLLRSIEALANSRKNSDDLLDVAEAFAAETLAGPPATVKALRLGARRAHTVAARQHAAALAEAQGRTKPTRQEFDAGKAAQASSETLARSALTNLALIVLTGEPTSEEALAELLGVSGIAPAGQAQTLPPILAAVSLPSLAEFVDAGTLAELEAARDEIRGCPATSPQISGPSSDLALAYRMLGVAAGRRTLHAAIS
jgi:hypothetical protein